MKENQFELSLAVQLNVVDFSKNADEREIFCQKMQRTIEATIRESISNPVREDEGVTSVRSVKVMRKNQQTLEE